jgi:acyl dehydratase
MWPRTGELRDCAVAFLGITDWSFRKPIFLGDTIHVHYTISNLRISQSNPRHGIVTFQVKVHNQYDDTLQEGTKVLLCSTDIVGPMADDSREQHE